MRIQRRLRIPVDPDETPMNGIVKVAFASTDRKRVDQHFGSAGAFAIYAIGQERTTLLEVVQFEDQRQDGHEDKLAIKLALLEGCAAVYCVAVGGSAIRQLIARGVQPVRVSEGTPIAPLPRELKTGLRQGASPWLGKAMDCIGCEACSRVCPKKCFTHSPMPLAA